MRITASRLAFCLLLLAGVCAPLWGLPILRRLELFRVQRAEVSGVQLLAPHEVLAASGVRAGQSVWDDPAPWLAALRAHPVVQAASIERALPGTLRIRIEERRPIALVDVGALRPATADGALLPVDPARAPLDLPLVRVPGLAGSALTVDDADARFLLAEAGRLAELDPAFIAQVSELHRRPTGELLLVLSEPAAELVLPAGADGMRLRQARAVLADLERRVMPARGRPRDHLAVRVDLRYADQVVVRLSSSR